MAGKIYINADNTVTLNKVKDLDGVFLNAGTCTFVLKTKKEGTVVHTGTLTYVTSSDGKYQEVIDASVTAGLVESDYYYLDVDFAEGSYDGYFRLEVQASYRG